MYISFTPLRENFLGRRRRAMNWSQENCLINNHCFYLRATGKGFLIYDAFICNRILPLPAQQEGVFVSLFLHKLRKCFLSDR